MQEPYIARRHPRTGCVYIERPGQQPLQCELGVQATSTCSGVQVMSAVLLLLLLTSARGGASNLPDCTLDHFVEMEHLEQLVERIAQKEGSSVLAVLQRFVQRIRLTLQQDKELSARMPPSFLGPSYYETVNQTPGDTENAAREDVVHPSSINELPTSELRKKPVSALPVGLPVYTFERTLRPPLGAIVHVNTGVSNAEVPDVTITVSPLMTVVEALRQADFTFQRTFGTSDDEDVISFGLSPLSNCYVISRFDNVWTNNELTWKVTVIEEGKAVYDDVCLPLEKKVVVKPGTTISLSYIRRI